MAFLGLAACDDPSTPPIEWRAFRFAAADNPGLGADVPATITSTAITATVPCGTAVTALVATFETNGASVAVGSTAQVSGTTPNNFTRPVTYTVAADDGSTKDFVVTVTIAPCDLKDIKSFKFLSAKNSELPTDVTATITDTATDTAIAATVPFGTDVMALVATFETDGASVAVVARPRSAAPRPTTSRAR